MLETLSSERTQKKATRLAVVYSIALFIGFILAGLCGSLIIMSFEDSSIKRAAFKEMEKSLEHRYPTSFSDMVEINGRLHVCDNYQKRIYLWDRNGWAMEEGYQIPDFIPQGFRDLVPGDLISLGDRVLFEYENELYLLQEEGPLKITDDYESIRGTPPISHKGSVVWARHDRPENFIKLYTLSPDTEGVKVEKIKKRRNKYLSTFILRSAGGRLLIIENLDGSEGVHYTFFDNDKLGEEQTAPLELRYAKLANIPDRTVLYKLRDKKGIFGTKKILRLWELKGDSWEEIRSLKVPTYKAHSTTVYITQMEGRLNVLWGVIEKHATAGLHRMELKRGKWKDVGTMDKDKSKKSSFPAGLMLSGYFLFLVGSYIFSGIIFVGPVLASAHYKFKARKDPVIRIGEQTFTLATFGKRTLALAVDLIPCFFLLILGSFTLGLVFVFLYFFLQEFKYGRTLGKRAAGIRVIMEDGSPCDLQGAAKRTLLRIVDFTFFFIPLMAAVALSPRYQRIGDMVGKTLVVEG